jgi:hypothetical protein
VNCADPIFADLGTSNTTHPSPDDPDAMFSGDANAGHPLGVSVRLAW